MAGTQGIVSLIGDRGGPNASAPLLMCAITFLFERDHCTAMLTGGLVCPAIFSDTSLPAATPSGTTTLT